MKKMILALSLLLSLNSFADGNGQVGSVGTEAPQTIEEVTARIAELSKALETAPDNETRVKIIDELDKLSKSVVAMLPPSAPRGEPSLPQVKEITVTADKFLVTPDRIRVGGYYSKIRVTALDNAVTFTNGIRLINDRDNDRLGFQIYRLGKGESEEFDLTHDFYSPHTHRWELRTDMYISEIHFEITSGNLVGSRGKLKIELIP